MKKPYLILGGVTVLAIVIVMVIAVSVSPSTPLRASTSITQVASPSPEPTLSVSTLVITPTINKNGGEKKPVDNVTQLKIEDTTLGSGTEAKAGNKITVHYTGTLLDGTKFDSSSDRGQPFTFNLGAGEVIKGWDMGFAGMKVGGKRKLTIPSSLAYGERGAGALIPPNSALIFTVELLKVE